MNEQVTTPWQGNWELRLRSKLESLGFTSLEEFLADNPGVGYVKLAESLGDAKIAAMQIYGEQIRAAAARGDLRSAAKDCLVRFMNEELKRGWGVGRHFLYRKASVYADWSTTINAHAHGDERVAARLKAIFDQLEAANPPKGWLPKGSNDEIIERSFVEAWPVE